MMKAADLGERDDPASARRLNRTRFGTIFPERQMSSESMVIRQVGRQETPQVILMIRRVARRNLTSARSQVGSGTGASV